LVRPVGGDHAGRTSRGRIEQHGRNGFGPGRGCAFPANQLPAFLRDHITPLMPSFWFVTRRATFSSAAERRLGPGDVETCVAERGAAHAGGGIVPAKIQNGIARMKTIFSIRFTLTWERWRPPA